MAGGTIWHYLGGHISKIRNIIFNSNGLAGRGLWLDTGQASATSTTISSITRSGNVVTATLAATKTWPSGTNIFLTGVSDTSFNGMFPVWYQTDTTHISWSQSGADGTSSGGTIQTKVGGDNSGLTLSHNHFYESVQTGTSISSCSITSNVLSCTLSAPQIIYANQWVWITGSSDPVYNAYWWVTAVTSPTTFTAAAVEVSSEASTTSGTFFPSTTGVSIGSNALAEINSSVCCTVMEKNNFEGTGNGGYFPLFGVEVDASSNTKDFWSKNNGFSFLRIGWMDPHSGIFVSDADGGTDVIDALFATSVNGTVVIKNGEWESTVTSIDYPFVLGGMISGSFEAASKGTAGQFEVAAGLNNSGTVELSNNQFELEGNYPDPTYTSLNGKVAVFTSATTLLQNNLFGAIQGTIPIINVSVSPGMTSGRTSVVSRNNNYSNVTPGTWAPIYNQTSPLLSSKIPNQLTRVTSQYDQTSYGSPGNQASYPLLGSNTTTQINAQSLNTLQDASVGGSLSVGKYMASATTGFGPLYANYITDSLFSAGLTYWTVFGSPTVTPNAGPDIFGGTSAMELTASPGNGFFFYQNTGQSMAAGSTYQLSFFAWGGTGGEVFFFDLHSGDTACEASGGLPSSIALTNVPLTYYSYTCVPGSTENAIPAFGLNSTSGTQNVFISQPQVCEVAPVNNCNSDVVTPTTGGASGTGIVLNGHPFPAPTGSGGGLTTGPTTATANDVATFNGTGGQIQDSGTQLTAFSSLYNVGGTLQTLPHQVFLSVSLAGGTYSATLTGSAAFTSSSTYDCSLHDTTTPGTAVYVSTFTSGSAFTITGTGTDAIRGVCTGN